MRILYLHREKAACDYHRIFTPFRCLPLEDGEKSSFKSDKEGVMVRDFRMADLVVFNRHPIVNMDWFIDLKKKFKFKVWCDIDDIWELYKHHYLYDSWNKEGTEKLIIQSMQLADIVTVTNNALLKRVKQYNDKCVVIPNALPINHEQFSSRKVEDTMIRFMYAGGPSHYHDLYQIREFFERASTHVLYKVRVSFCMSGYDDRNIDLKRMNSIMNCAPNYRVRGPLSLNTYMDHYNYADVAISPLEDNEFNTYKSNLKIIEAGCMRTPILVSQMHPFLQDEEMSSRGVFFCKTVDDWVGAYDYLVRNPHKIVQYGNELYDYVYKKYDLLEINNKRREIINNFKMELK